MQADQKSRHCERCRAQMTLAFLVPRVASMPELRAFRCDHCGHVETIAVERPA
jgi:DNA-directed RNA polymerase subunit RPC12/RpoP